MGPKSQKKSGAKHSDSKKTKSKGKTKGQVERGNEKEDLNDQNSIVPAEPNDGGSNEESEVEEGEVEEGEIPLDAPPNADYKDVRRAMLIELLTDDDRFSEVAQSFDEFCIAQDFADSRSLDLKTNLAAYYKWKDERDDQRSEASENSATKSSEVPTAALAATKTKEDKNMSFLERSGDNNRGGKTPDSETEVGKSFYAILQLLGKTSYPIETRNDIEKLIRFLKAHAGVPFTSKQRQAIYNLLLTERVKSQVNMTLLDISKPEIGSSERKPYHNWTKGIWYDGGDKTATLQELTEFYEDISLPRSDPALNSEETFTVRLQTEVLGIVKIIISPKFLTENNKSPSQAVEHLVKTFKEIESTT
jgi:hypothetical protein